MVDGNKFKFRYFGAFKQRIWFFSLLGSTTGGTTLIGAIIRNLLFKYLKRTTNTVIQTYILKLNNVI